MVNYLSNMPSDTREGFDVNDRADDDDDKFDVSLNDELYNMETADEVDESSYDEDLYADEYFDTNYGAVDSEPDPFQWVFFKKIKIKNW